MLYKCFVFAGIDIPIITTLPAVYYYAILTASTGRQSNAGIMLDQPPRGRVNYYLVKRVMIRSVRERKTPIVFVNLYL